MNSDNAERGIVYLACPYTHPDEAVRRYRFDMATLAASRLVAEGHIVFSPITMTHPIDLLLAGQQGTLGSHYWVQFDKAFMECCSELRVLNLDGWEKSSGVGREMDFFRTKDRPISYIEPDSLSDSTVEKAVAG